MQIEIYLLSIVLQLGLGTLPIIAFVMKLNREVGELKAKVEMLINENKKFK